jgi:hypothetical protein
LGRGVTPRDHLLARRDGVAREEAMEDLQRALEKAERWAAIMEQHGQMDTAYHETARRLRAALAAQPVDDGQQTTED